MPRAILLACSIEAAEAEALRSQGVEVQTFGQLPSLRELAHAALEIRRRQPRPRLLVAGPEQLVRELARRYPAMVDASPRSATLAAVLAALD